MSKDHQYLSNSIYKNIRRFDFGYIIYFMIREFGLKADKFATEALGYADYSGFDKMKKKEYGVPKNFNAKNVIDYLVTKEIFIKHSEEHLKVIRSDLEDLVRASALTKKQKSNILEVQEITSFLELILKYAYQVNLFGYEDNAAPRCECAKLINISKALHDYVHNLRDEYYLIPFLYEQNIDAEDKLTILVKVINEHTSLLVDILKQITGEEALVVLERLIYDVNDKNQEPLLIPMRYSSDLEKQVKPLNSSSDYLQIVEKKVQIIQKRVKGNENKFDEQFVIIAPIRLNHMINPSIASKRKLEGNNSQYPSTYTDLKNKIKDNTNQQDYNLLGFLSVTINGFVSFDNWEFCSNIVKTFCDSLYKYIERTSFYKII